VHLPSFAIPIGLIVIAVGSVLLVAGTAVPLWRHDWMRARVRAAFRRPALPRASMRWVDTVPTRPAQLFLPKTAHEIFSPAPPAAACDRSRSRYIFQKTGHHLKTGQSQAEHGCHRSCVIAVSASSCQVPTRGALPLRPHSPVAAAASCRHVLSSRSLTPGFLIAPAG
jgi:hypothetical protein